MRPELKLAIVAYLLISFAIPYFVGYAVGATGVDLGAGFLPILWISTFIAGYLTIRSLAKQWKVKRPLRLTILAWIGAFFLPLLLSWVGVAIWYWGVRKEGRK